MHDDLTPEERARWAAIKQTGRDILREIDMSVPGHWIRLLDRAPDDPDILALLFAACWMGEQMAPDPKPTWRVSGL